MFHAKRLITKKKEKNNKSRNKLSMIIRGRSIDLGGIYKYSKQRSGNGSEGNDNESPKRVLTSSKVSCNELTSIFA